MALPSSGTISIGQIRANLNTSNGSLRFLSSRAGKSTPDSMSEFRGYQYPPAYITYSQNVGQLYDGCSMSMDSYGQWEGTDVGGYYIGPYSGGGNEGYNVYNSERGTNAGTFLTFGGNGWGYVIGGSTVTVTAYSNGYGLSPCTPIFSFINVGGVRRANTNTNSGFTAISYSFTAASGGSYTVEFGLGYGSV
jgi:hypothetical protein